jgi:hypothetical protein
MTRELIRSPASSHTRYHHGLTAGARPRRAAGPSGVPRTEPGHAVPPSLGAPAWSALAEVLALPSASRVRPGRPATNPKEE